MKLNKSNAGFVSFGSVSNDSLNICFNSINCLAYFLFISRLLLFWYCLFVRFFINKTKKLIKKYS